MRDESLPILAAAGDMFWLVVWTLWAATSAIFRIWSGYSGDKKSSWWWEASYGASCFVAAFFFRRPV